MKTAIIYYSEHHGNTKKLLDAIAAHEDVTLVDATSTPKTDLSAYDLIGFASGIYYSKFHDDILKFAEKNLPYGKKVFFIYTCGMKRKFYTDALKQITDSKGAQLLGVYDCPGWDTLGPLRFVGGVAKKRPNDADIAGAVKFFGEIGGEGESAQ
jgi:flavodoxin